jgi:hypothetical protein
MNFKHGRGREELSDGSVFEGNFNYNIRENKGKYLSPRGVFELKTI